MTGKIRASFIIATIVFSMLFLPSISNSIGKTVKKTGTNKTSTNDSTISPSAAPSTFDSLNGGDYAMDIAYSWSYSYEAGRSANELTLSVTCGSTTNTYNAGGVWPTTWTGSGSFTLSTIRAVNFNLKIDYVNSGGKFPYTEYNAVSLTADPTTGPTASGSDFFFSASLSFNPIANVQSLTTSVSYANSASPYQVTFSVTNPSGVGTFWFGNVHLQRQIGTGGAWTEIKSWTSQDIPYEVPQAYSYPDSYTTSSNDVNIIYRVELENTHFVYKSLNSPTIVINPTRPFISSMSVVLAKEYSDPGVLTPTDEVYLVISVVNPTAAPVTRLSVEFERGFTDDPQNAILGDTSEPVTIASGDSVSLTFKAAADHSGDFAAYLVPGVLQCLINGLQTVFPYYDQVLNANVNLDTWNWCDITTGTLLQSQRQINYSAWIVGDKPDTLTSMYLTVFVAQSKASNLYELNYLITNKGELNDLKTVLSYISIGTIFLGVKGIVAYLVSIGKLATDLGPAGWIVGVAGAAAWLASAFILPALINSDAQEIAQLILAIGDPVDSDISEIAPITYTPLLNMNIQQEIMNNSYLMHVYNTFDNFNRMQAVTSARVITQERYNAAVALGDETAAELQANTLRSYTSIETSYLNNFLYNNIGVFDGFTIHNIVLNNGSISMNDVYTVISSAQNVVRQAGGFPSAITQYLINEGNTSAEIDQIQNQFLAFNVDTFDNDLIATYNAYDLAANQFFAGESNIISGLYDGANSAIFISRHLDYQPQFTSSSNNQRNREVFEVGITPLFQDVNSGSSATSTLQISNSLSTQAITATINLGGIDASYLSYFSFPSSITIAASQSSPISITINVPDDIPPMVLNPTITISTTVSGITYTKTQSVVYSILDDDVAPPVITIKQFSPPDIFGWQVMIGDGDGLKDVASATYIVTLNGVEISSGTFLETDGWKQISLPVECGVFNISISSTNNENNYPGEEQTSTASASFEITVPFLRDYIIGELTQLDNNVKASSYSQWAKPWYKCVVSWEVDLVSWLFDHGYTNQAYDDLLFTIRPWLAGSTTSEHGKPWDHYTCRNSLITDPVLRSTLVGEVNSILTHVTAYQAACTASAIKSLSNELTTLGQLVNQDLTGSKIAKCDRLLTHVTTAYSALLSDFQQNGIVNCTAINKLQHDIVEIKEIARNSAITTECNTIFGLINTIVNGGSPTCGWDWGWYFCWLYWLCGDDH
ncbi:MAG TPA: hypothetical protein VKM55_00330 [Candidatus Lokiarchaeia archaeon]|nr:hypothetical protein [Candidatus Lokiarchaeia archaeon]